MAPGALKWMAIISTPLWSLFLATRRNSSSLMHIKLDKTSFLNGLSLSKDYWVHIFLFYFLFKSFPILLLVLILISRFNFILVWFNLGFWWSIAKGASKQLGVSLKTSNRGKTKIIQAPCEIFAGHAKLMNHFAWGEKISHTLRINFTHYTKMKRPC